MMKQAAVFDDIYKSYIDKVSAIDLNLIRRSLGVEVDQGAAVIPFFGIPHRVSGNGVVNDQGVRPIHAVSVILCQYLLRCPKSETPASTEWVTYHSYKDAAPFAGGFRNTAETPISKTFSGRLDDLKRGCGQLGGVVVDTPVRCDLAIRIKALPKVNLMIVFNDKDDEFPADTSILFEKNADAYLDMECLAMVGMVLAVWLKNGPDYSAGNI